MMLLDPKEKMFIDTYLTLPVSCPARRYSDKLYIGRPRREELLDMEIFLGQISEHCHERWMFRRLYEDYQLRAGIERDRRNQPTTQEQDRKASKKAAVRIAAWCQNVRRKVDGICTKITNFKIIK